MNKFEVITKKEYDKLVAENFRFKNGITEYQRHEDIKTPCRATIGSAGYDFFSPVSFKLKPGETIKLPTCIKCRLNRGNVLLIFPRSSLGFNYRMQLDNTVGVIDEDYYNNESNEGNIYMKITNDSKTCRTLEIHCGDAIAQGIIVSYGVTDDDEVSTMRIGGIGSTSKPVKGNLNG